MKLQTIKSKIGEANYRSKISLQHLGQKTVFANEPSVKEIRNILKKRLRENQIAFNDLKKRNINLSPFLEIGAEYGLASAFLATKFHADGFAVDISQASLSQAKKFAKIFKLKKVPITICADAYNLPFKSNSFPFVFVYESLHHFPHPKPVMLEAKRILSPGGTLLIGAEPIKQTLQLKFWRRPTKLRKWEKILKYALILPFISHIGKTEIEHGILEEAFSLKTWEETFSLFDQIKIEITTIAGLKQTITKTQNTNWLKPNLVIKLLIFFSGGGIKAQCKNEARTKNTSDLKISLICPNCKRYSHREIILKKMSGSLVCPKCQNNYQEKNGVFVILEKDLEKSILKIK